LNRAPGGLCSAKKFAVSTGSRTSLLKWNGDSLGIPPVATDPPTRRTATRTGRTAERRREPRGNADSIHAPAGAAGRRRERHDEGGEAHVAPGLEAEAREGESEGELVQRRAPRREREHGDCRRQEELEAG
jgi:hypothetical protein